MNWYEMQQAEKKARYEKYAENAERRSASAFDAAWKSIEHIPPGQPILVGHHSERRHRSDLDRHDRGMRRGFDERNKAAYWRDRADSLGTAGISREDPGALEKLREKIAELEAKQSKMKEMNARYRAALKAAKGDERAAMLALGASESAADEWANRSYKWEKSPYASYSLSNLSANLRRYRERLARLEREAAEFDGDYEAAVLSRPRGTMRRIHAKRAGSCSFCGAAFGAGDYVCWWRSTKEIAPYSCPCDGSKEARGY